MRLDADILTHPPLLGTAGTPEMPEAPEFVIIGGGIIGLCTAYYLLESPNLPPNARVTLLENTAVACGASSKAAGFVACGTDWHRTANHGLARLSAKAFADLARRFNGAESYGWRECTATSVLVEVCGDDMSDPHVHAPEGCIVSDPDSPTFWVNGEPVPLGNGRKTETAQLLPTLFCSRIYQHCIQRGLRTVIATPTGRTGKVIHTTSGDIPYTSLALTAGPWCNDVCRVLDLPLVAVVGGPGHTVQIQPGILPTGFRDLPSQALFVGVGRTLEAASEYLAGLDTECWFRELPEDERREGWTRTVQLFARADGKVFAAGENAIPHSLVSEPYADRKYRLPLSAAEVPNIRDQALVARLLRATKAISPVLDVDLGAKIIRTEFSYRPTTMDRLPVMGEIEENVFVCAGHGSWGIALAPGSGMVTAELLIADALGVEPKLSADISGLSPDRFEPEDIRDAEDVNFIPTPGNFRG